MTVRHPHSLIVGQRKLLRFQTLIMSAFIEENHTHTPPNITFTNEPNLPRKPGSRAHHCFSQICNVQIFLDQMTLKVVLKIGQQCTCVTVNRNGICFVHVAFLLLSFYMKRMVEIEKRQMSFFKYETSLDDLNLALSSKLRIIRLLIIICRN